MDTCCSSLIPPDITEDCFETSSNRTFNNREYARIIHIFFIRSSKHQSKIVNAIREWEKHANIHFLITTDINQADIIVNAKSDVNNSYIGLSTSRYFAKKGEVTLNLCNVTKGTILHEFGHALGLEHTHQLPSAFFIPWNKEFIYEYYKKPPNNWDRKKVDRNIFKCLPPEQVFAGAFDPNSVMCYNIRKDHLMEGRIHVSNSTDCLSWQDKVMINSLYPFFGKWSGFWNIIAKSATDGSLCYYQIQLKQNGKEIRGVGNFPSQKNWKTPFSCEITGEILDFGGSKVKLQLEWENNGGTTHAIISLDDSEKKFVGKYSNDENKEASLFIYGRKPVLGIPKPKYEISVCRKWMKKWKVTVDGEVNYDIVFMQSGEEIFGQGFMSTQGKYTVDNMFQCEITELTRLSISFKQMWSTGGHSVVKCLQQSENLFVCTYDTIDQQGKVEHSGKVVLETKPETQHQIQLAECPWESEWIVTSFDTSSGSEYQINLKRKCENKLEASGTFEPQGVYSTPFEYSLDGEFQGNQAYWIMEWRGQGRTAVHSRTFVSVIMSPCKSFMDGIWTSYLPDQQNLKGLENGVFLGRTRDALSVPPTETMRTIAQLFKRFQIK